MTDETFGTDRLETQQPAAEAHAAATGNPTVDEVLTTLERLEELPAVEHVAVFESAHERLRAVLTAAGESGQD